MAAVLATALVVTTMPALAHHGDPLLTYVDASGDFSVGLYAVGVEQVNLARSTFHAHPCHPLLQVLLDYSPANASVWTQKAAVEVPFEFQVELVDGDSGERLPGGVLRFRSPGSAWYALPPDAARGGALRADLYLLVGAQTNWSLRIRGWLQTEGCVIVSEVEANPNGVDAGGEWVELANLGLATQDLSGWTVRAHHGQPQALVLPNGTLLSGAGHLVVAFPTQFLDNTDEIVTLEAQDGVEYARTPPLTDAADDGRTNQLVPENSVTWDFRPGTPGTAG
ncbi:MAG: lamin tail domain-containing protein [Candidatus Thermoplasmatota archaeon]